MNRRQKQKPGTLNPTSVLNNNTIHLAQHKAQSHSETDKHEALIFSSWFGESYAWKSLRTTRRSSDEL